jgi:hypothetical protein
LVKVGVVYDPFKAYSALMEWLDRFIDKNHYNCSALTITQFKQRKNEKTEELVFISYFAYEKFYTFG